MNIRPFTDALRKNGVWRKDYDSRSGGVRVVQFVRRVNLHRFLELQLWDGGQHRISFMEDGRMSTPPTPFKTVPEMLKAIEIESVKPPKERT